MTSDYSTVQTQNPEMPAEPCAGATAASSRGWHCSCDKVPSSSRETEENILPFNSEDSRVPSCSAAFCTSPSSPSLAQAGICCDGTGYGAGQGHARLSAHARLLTKHPWYFRDLA